MQESAALLWSGTVYLNLQHQPISNQVAATAINQAAGVIAEHCTSDVVQKHAYGTIRVIYQTQDKVYIAI